jgi:2,3-bisphosphoglycerate-independent phosphoglycerate mutase
VFVFLDGVGLGPDDESNPFWTAQTPALRRLLGAPLADGLILEQPGLLLKGLDACLGVAGLPQSATGQTALFTGVNAPAVEGMHISAWPTAKLREVIAQHSLLKRAVEAGFRVTFANAYSKRYWQLVERRKLHHSASTLTNMAAGLPFRTLDDLRRGEAIYWDITHLAAREYNKFDLPLIAPEQAGARLANLSQAYDLVMYETFLPDLVGHRRAQLDPVLFLDRMLDPFLAGLLEAVAPETTIVICSDHGNLENTRSKAHTRNPVPLLAAGPGAACFCNATAITDVADGILATLHLSRCGRSPTQPLKTTASPR